jgi:hypothetical protein
MVHHGQVSLNSSFKINASKNSKGQTIEVRNKKNFNQSQ